MNVDDRRRLMGPLWRYPVGWAALLLATILALLSAAWYAWHGLVDPALGALLILVALRGWMAMTDAEWEADDADGAE